MDWFFGEYIVEKIVKNKIKNNLYCPIKIFDTKIFDYNGKQYINVYFYSKITNITCLYINDNASISIFNAKSLKNEYDVLLKSVKFACFLYNDSFKNMTVTKYKFLNNVENKNSVYKIDKELLINYEDYDLNSNNLRILRGVEHSGFSIISTLPKIKKDYWICACGHCNTGDVCSYCQASKELALKYSSEKEIHQSYAKGKLLHRKFRLVSLKHDIASLEKNIDRRFDPQINFKYLDDSFIDEISKMKEYNDKPVMIFDIYSKLTLVILLIVIIYLFIIFVFLIYNYFGNNF